MFPNLYFQKRSIIRNFVDRVNNLVLIADFETLRLISWPYVTYRHRDKSPLWPAVNNAEDKRGSPLYAEAWNEKVGNVQHPTSSYPILSKTTINKMSTTEQTYIMVK